LTSCPTRQNESGSGSLTGPSGSTAALWDDILSGYPNLDAFPTQEPIQAMLGYYEIGTNTCWCRDPLGWCNRPIRNQSLGLCDHHIEELREATNA
jgi:hypothetical protein